MQFAARRLAALVAAVALSGCASLRDSPLWPSYTRDYCYPRASFHRNTKKTTLGVKCHFSENSSPSPATSGA